MKVFSFENPYGEIYRPEKSGKWIIPKESFNHEIETVKREIETGWKTVANHVLFVPPPPEPTPMEWLRSQVEEMCELGRSFP